MFDVLAFGTPPKIQNSMARGTVINVSEQCKVTGVCIVRLVSHGKRTPPLEHQAAFVVEVFLGHKEVWGWILAQCCAKIVAGASKLLKSSIEQLINDEVDPFLFIRRRCVTWLRTN